MDTAFDYSKTYYKVVRKNHNHNGFIYKKGLNVLNEPFNDNPKASCVGGRLYITDYENLPLFLYHGDLIYEVTIPKDARVVKDPDGNKWGADRLVLGRCYRIAEDFDKWFDKEKFKYDKDGSLALAVRCSEHFDRWFDKEKFNYDKYSSFALAAYCSAHFDKWFDKETFDYKFASDILAANCSKDFDKWFDKEKFKFGKDSSFALAAYCSAHFDKWFDEEKFNFDDTYVVRMLKNNCSDYKHIWGKYVKY